MAMFPLGAVLFPHMPLRLRVFEERYLLMLSELVAAGRASGEAVRFGVVLIERGFEVGGGEQRFGLGTAAEVVHLGAEAGFVGLTAQGTTRVEVVSWLDETPHPRAEVRERPELVWHDALTPLREETERLVRRTLSQASEFAEGGWAPDVALSDDPVAACWQLAAIAPLGELDQLTLLGAGSVEQLLTDLQRLTNEAGVRFSAPWPDAE
jgi:Lon protease-like protein